MYEKKKKLKTRLFIKKRFVNFFYRNNGDKKLIYLAKQTLNILLEI